MDERKPIILEDKKFALYGPRNPEGRQGPPKMSFGVYNGNASIVVFPNDPSDQESKPIRAGMDALAWGAFISACKQIIDGDPEKAIRLINRKGPPQKTFPDSTTVVGKDADGVIYLAVLKEGRAKKKFKVLPGTYHDFCDANGNVLPEGEKSRLYAIGFFDQLNMHMTHYLRQTYVPPQPPNGGNRRGGGGGGYNRGGNGGGNGGGYNSGGGSSGGFDDGGDDLPM